MSVYPFGTGWADHPRWPYPLKCCAERTMHGGPGCTWPGERTFPLTANPGRLAQCDHPGCDAELRVVRGEDARSVLESEGWAYAPENLGPLVVSDLPGDTFCPVHRPKREYLVRIVRDEHYQYMPPHHYQAGTSQPIEKLMQLVRDESYDPTITVEIISERDWEQPEGPGRPMTGPHPHNMPEEWRDDGKCIIKSCGVYRTTSASSSPPDRP